MDEFAESSMQFQHVLKHSEVALKLPNDERLKILFVIAVFYYIIFHFISETSSHCVVLAGLESAL